MVVKKGQFTYADLKNKPGLHYQDIPQAEKMLVDDQRTADMILTARNAGYVLPKNDGAFANEAKTWIPLFAAFGYKVNLRFVESLMTHLSQFGRDTAVEIGAHLCRNNKDELDLSSRVCKGNSCSVAIKDCMGGEDIGTIHYHPGRNAMPTIGDLYNTMRLAVENVDQGQDVDARLDCNMIYDNNEKAGDSAVLTCFKAKLPPGKTDDQIGDDINASLGVLMAKMIEGTIQANYPFYAFPRGVDHYDLFQVPLWTEKAYKTLKEAANAKEYGKKKPRTWKIDWASYRPDKKDQIGPAADDIAMDQLSKVVEEAVNEMLLAIEFENPSGIPQRLLDNLGESADFFEEAWHDDKKQLAETLDALAKLAVDAETKMKNESSEIMRRHVPWYELSHPCNIRVGGDIVDKLRSMTFQFDLLGKVAVAMWGLGGGPYAKNVEDYRSEVFAAMTKGQKAIDDWEQACECHANRTDAQISFYPVEEFAPPKYLKAEVIERGDQ